MEIIDAIPKLESLRRGVFFSLGAYAVLTKPESAQSLLAYSINVSNARLQVMDRSQPEAVPEERLSEEISFERVLEDHAARNIVEISIVHMISKSFDVISELRKENKLSADVSKEAWYQFARHIRNAYSHDYKWNFHPETLSNLEQNPIEWKNLRIESNMQGEEVYGFLGDFDALQLNSEMLEYLKRNSEDVVQNNENDGIRKVIKVKV